MKIIRTSQLTGIRRIVELPVTLNQIARFEKGEEYIQDIFPDLTPGQREFIKTGISEEEWDEAFKDVE